MKKPRKQLVSLKNTKVQSKPRICMVSDHGCIRVFKEAKALRDLGYIVELIVGRLPTGTQAFSTLSIWTDHEQFKREVAASSADIFHIHNEPDWMVRETREATKKPIVYDIHDLESMRWNGRCKQDEQDAFDCADAYVHVSDPCKAFADYVHADKIHKPNIVLHP